ncbi:MAG: S9 family peptidase, partial [Gammaproteobacteria bacterium]|nr:S9 family peptidase [Gammaproteobacteria bacterium]
MACSESHQETVSVTTVYPETAKVGHIDNYHGVEVADPYRWLEDDVRENSAVSDWVGAQNEITFAYLEDIPEREIIERRLTQLWDYEKYGLPVKEGGRYFYEYNDGLQNQEQIFIQSSL